MTKKKTKPKQKKSEAKSVISGRVWDWGVGSISPLYNAVEVEITGRDLANEMYKYEKMAEEYARMKAKINSERVPEAGPSIYMTDSELSYRQKLQGGSSPFVDGPPPNDVDSLLRWCKKQKNTPALIALGKMVEQQKEVLDRLDQGAKMIATVVSIDDEQVLINLRGTEVIVKNPKELEIYIGAQVTVHPETQQISGIVKVQQPGIEASLVEDLGKEAVVDLTGRRMRLPKDPKLHFEAGSIAIIDRTTSVVLGAAPAPKEYIVNDLPDIHWDDIGGLQTAKAEMREAIDTAIISGDIYKEFGKKPLKGILLYGPPGCGKTLIAKAAANQIAKHRKELPTCDGAFLYVKGPELLSMWVGDTENKIRELFRRASKYKKEVGVPGVIFLDEAESLLAGRGMAGSSGISRTVVPAFLAEWDGLEESGALLILATNRPNDLDDAVMREGRVDRKIEIVRPDLKHSAEILFVHLGKTICKDPVEELAVETAKSLFKQARLVKKVSGAMLANLVDRAVSSAIRRAIESEGKDKGLLHADLDSAMEHMSVEYKNLN